MSPFEFFFSLYGLILGLAVTEVVTGFARVLKASERVRLGYATPMLGVLMLVDLASFWVNAWEHMRDVEVGLPLLLMGLVIAGVYFLAASLVFPDELEAWPSLDAFYDSHKGWVIGGVITANMIADFGITALMTTPHDYFSRVITVGHLGVAAVFLALVIGVALIRDRRINAVLMAGVFALYAHPWTWVGVSSFNDPSGR